MSKRRRRSSAKSYLVEKGSNFMEPQVQTIKRIGLCLIKEDVLDLSKGCTPHCIYFYSQCNQCDYDGHLIKNWKTACPRAKYYNKEGEK